jgi:hypothetical protein
MASSQATINKKSVAVFFLVLLGFALIVSLWAGYKKRTPELTQLSRTEIESVTHCAPELLKSLGNDHLMCSFRNERKHNITLLSSVPATPLGEIRSMYEEIANLATYSQYRATSSHIQACNHQTGPWELYCRGTEKGGCTYKHPPPWEVPYVVKSEYPAYAALCDQFGYDLVTHDALIHIIRNPIDAIAEWQATKPDENPNSFTEYYASWHQFWKNYELANPEVDTLWIRYEDFVLCKATAMRNIFFNTGLWNSINQTKFYEVLSSLDEPNLDFGQGMSKYVKSFFSGF